MKVVVVCFVFEVVAYFLCLEILCAFDLSCLLADNVVTDDSHFCSAFVDIDTVVIVTT